MWFAAALTNQSSQSLSGVAPDVPVLLHGLACSALSVLSSGSCRPSRLPPAARLAPNATSTTYCRPAQRPETPARCDVVYAVDAFNQTGSPQFLPRAVHSWPSTFASDGAARPLGLADQWRACRMESAPRAAPMAAPTKAPWSCIKKMQWVARRKNEREDGRCNEPSPTCAGYCCKPRAKQAGPSHETVKKISAARKRTANTDSTTSSAWPAAIECTTAALYRDAAQTWLASQVAVGCFRQQPSLPSTYQYSAAPGDTDMQARSGFWLHDQIKVPSTRSRVAGAMVGARGEAP